MTKTELLKLIDKQEKDVRNIIVVTKESTYYIMGKIFKGKNGFITFNEYDEDLTCNEDNNFNINEIWYGDMFGNAEFDPYHKTTLIWTRKDMPRQTCNIEILKILSTKFPENDELYYDIEYLINQYPDQRFGQIFCNYICPDYRLDRKSVYTNILINKWFGNSTLDPFFEESKETLIRLQNA